MKKYINVLLHTVLLISASSVSLYAFDTVYSNTFSYQYINSELVHPVINDDSTISDGSELIIKERFETLFYPRTGSGFFWGLSLKLFRNENYTKGFGFEFMAGYDKKQSPVPLLYLGSGVYREEELIFHNKQEVVDHKPFYSPSIFTQIGDRDDAHIYFNFMFHFTSNGPPTNINMYYEKEYSLTEGEIALGYRKILPFFIRLYGVGSVISLRSSTPFHKYDYVNKL